MGSVVNSADPYFFGHTNMTKFQQTQSGLVIPKEKPQPSELEVKYKHEPLVITDEEDHKECGRLFAEMLKLRSFQRGGILIGQSSLDKVSHQSRSRRALLMSVSRLMVGQDFEVEEYC